MRFLRHHADRRRGTDHAVRGKAPGTRPARHAENGRLDSQQAGHPRRRRSLLASMGIYVFNRDVLDKALAGKHVDFGKHIIPNLIKHRPPFLLRLPGLLGGHRNHQGLLRRQSRPGQRSAQVQLLRHPGPDLHPCAYLPASKIVRGHIERAAIADGCIIVDARSNTPSSASAAGSSRRRHQGFHPHGPRRLRNAGGNPGRHRARHPPLGVGATPTSSGPSSIKTPASGTMSASRPRASRRTTTATIITSATESSSCPRAA
jgi:hypothetical protein